MSAGCWRLAAAMHAGGARSVGLRCLEVGRGHDAHRPETGRGPRARWRCEHAVAAPTPAIFFVFYAFCRG